MDQHPTQGEQKYSQLLHGTEVAGISSGVISHLADFTIVIQLHLVLQVKQYLSMHYYNQNSKGLHVANVFKVQRNLTCQQVTINCFLIWTSQNCAHSSQLQYMYVRRQSKCKTKSNFCTVVYYSCSHDLTFLVQRYAP